MPKKTSFDEPEEFGEDFSEFEDGAEAPRTFDEVDTDDPAAMLERFEAMVDDRMKLLLSRSADAKVRAEAAYWLGNSGVPKAITALRKIYKGEKDPKIKKAAQYALGQFKALDLSIERQENEPVLDALEREENAVIRELLEEIALSGGPKAAGTPRALRAGQVLLGVLLVALIGINVAVMAGVLDGSSGGGAVAAQPTATIDPTTKEGRAINELNAMQVRSADVRGDAEALERQYTAFETAGTALDCAAAFKRPAAYTVPSVIQTDYPPVTPMGETLNTAIGDLGAVFVEFDAACGRGEGLPLPAEVTRAKEGLARVLGALGPLETDINALREDILSTIRPTPTPTLQATATQDLLPSATPTPEVTVELTPTVSQAIINNSIRDMYAILDQVSGRDGARTLLLTFWTDVVNSGATNGCRVPPPSIPENYGEIPPEVLQARPRLEEARNEINTGLDLLRTGWAGFTSACAGDSLSALAAAGQQTAQLADTQFNSANNILNEVRRQ